MLNYKSYIPLKRNFDLLYLSELMNSSIFIIYFNYNKILNKNLYYLKNEVLKKNLKSFTINSIYIKSMFENKFKFLNSNTFFIFCNNILDFTFVLDLLKNINFFFIFNKNFSNFYSNIMLNKNLNFFHFILFKVIFYLLIVILFYIINFVRNLIEIL